MDIVTESSENKLEPCLNKDKKNVDFDIKKSHFIKKLLMEYLKICESKNKN
uniref:Uncharacterized protein n=1 Tax=viral metagenome TaxID=1070528 RepID=A0A6C0BC49_9ZZZZ